MRAKRIWTAVLAAGATGAVVVAHGVAAEASGPAGCHYGRLAVTMTHIPGSDGAGHTEYRLSVRNNGGRACALGSHPDLRLLSAADRPLPTHVHKEGATRTITVGAQETVSARLRFSPDVPGPGESATGPCERVAHLVRVTLTAPAHGELVVRIKPPTSVCEHGAIQEDSL